MIGLEVDFGLRLLLRTLSVEQWVLRTSMAASAVVCLVATAQASDGGVGTFWILIVVLTGWWAVVSPDTAGPTTLIASLALCWWARVDDPMSGWVLVLALGGLAIHACAALACAGPPSVAIGSNTLVRWGIAFGSVAAGTALLWLVFLGLDAVDLSASTARLVLALLVVALFAWWIRRLSLDDSRD